MRQHESPRPRARWVRLALIESAVIAIGVLAIAALVTIDDRTRALMPFIAH
jgi:hypothetical protein